MLVHCCMYVSEPHFGLKLGKSSRKIKPHVLLWVASNLKRSPKTVGHVPLLSGRIIRNIRVDLLLFFLSEPRLQSL